jgi:predicted dehydrogenase
MSGGLTPDSYLKIGLIGLDTSHCVAFVQILNDPSAVNHVPGARVIAAVKTFSPDIEASASRVEQYTTTLRESYGVKMVRTIADLCREVDLVMIESLDGRVHLEQARAVIAEGKRLFIDKPMAGSLRDVIEIFRLAREAGVPVFSSSAYRFYPSLLKLKAAEVGEVRSAISYGPAYLEPHHPDLFFYGIHPVEALFAVMGCGCESVVRTHTSDSDVVIGQWQGGRVGTLHGLRTKMIPHKVIVFGADGFAEQMPIGAAWSMPRVRYRVETTTVRSWGRSSPFFTAACRRCVPRRRSRCSPLWKRPMKASDGVGCRCG